MEGVCFIVPDSLKSCRVRARSGGHGRALRRGDARARRRRGRDAPRALRRVRERAARAEAARLVFDARDGLCRQARVAADGLRPRRAGLRRPERPASA